jgi:cyclohexanone monooxygenase
VLQLLKRALIYAYMELRVPGFTRLPGALRLAQVLALGHLKRQVADPALRRKLTPDYVMGCKRILLSNNYYPALCQPHVQVHTTGIDRVVADGVVLTDGSHQPADVLIYGTGFAATDPLPAGMLFGQDGLDITDAWQNGPEAYLGTAVHGFPNLFLLVGPNTGLGHSSMVYMIESQIAYVLRALQAVERRQARQLVVRREVQDRYNVRLQQRLLNTVWHRGGCRSWYLHASGKNVTLWPGFTWQFRRATARFVPADYEWQ